MRIPLKLTNAPIVEALFEVRFSTSDIAEIAVSKLVARPEWRAYTAERLPMADFPLAVRESDPNLVHQPILQIQDNERTRIVKIGPRSLSYHIPQPYPGWSQFGPELQSCTEFLYGALSDVTATRFGFRYINALTAKHFVNSISDLTIAVQLNSEPLGGPQNINFQREKDSGHIATIRIASGSLVTNPSPDLTVLIDIDVSTPEGFTSPDARNTSKWVTTAHQYLKEEFFSLLPDTITDRLDAEKNK